MTDTTQETLSAKRAIDAAFSFFNEFYAKSETRPGFVLLEGLEFVEDRNEWQVTIGFDVGRERRPTLQMSLLDRGAEPVREFRVISIDGSDGRFLRMRSR